MSAIRAWKATSTPRASDNSLLEEEEGIRGRTPHPHCTGPRETWGRFFCLPPKGNPRHAKRPCPRRGNPRHAKRPAPVSTHPGFRFAAGEGSPLSIFRRTASADLCPAWKDGRYPLAGHVYAGNDNGVRRGTPSPGAVVQKGSSGMNFIRSARSVSCTSFLARLGSKPTRRLTMAVTSSGRLA
jgi:hypothetical protein